jgi:bifunctional non-homologous end joining protein LigD
VLPETPAPMLAVTAPEPFDDPDWTFEVKWDGVRAVTAVASGAGTGAVRLVSRQGNDLTGGYPEVGDLWRRLAVRSAVLDGELVAFGEDGRPSFQRLQQRMHLRGAADVARARARMPVVYVVFDLLAVDGRDLCSAPLEERTALLSDLLEPGPSILVSERFPGEGRGLYAAAEAQGLEGVMGKRLASRYRPGARSSDWRKIKVRRRTQVVVGGWLPGEGSRGGELGALLVGWADGPLLRSAGRVGTGFDTAERRRLLARLAEIPSDAPPFADPPAVKGARWVRPVLVTAVEYAELTAAGRLRAPSYKGLVDADPRTCLRPDASGGSTP